MSKAQRRVAIRVLFYALLVVIFVYITFPFYWALRSSVTPNNELFATPVSYWPEQPTLANYQQVLSDNHFLQALLNSTIVAVSVTVLSLIIGVLGSYALGRFRFRGRMPIMYLVLSMTMFPQIAVLGALFQRITQFGLYNQLPGLILTYLIFTLPFTVWVLTSFFEAMPRDLEEAAYVDGCTPVQTMYMVMLPLVAPGLVTTGLLAFIGAWNEFLFALSFIQTPDKHTVPIALVTFAVSTAGGFEIPWGPIQAATIVVTVPLIVLTLIFQRRILAGLTAGAVKG
ncbi:MAG: carbohydrate ABC transporter permease [Chloroflexota bacterium]|nr:carbohydrate ABC transporter permease [Chloroflexota bacterium]